MFDHFRFVASFYDRVIPLYDHERLARLLGLPCDGWLLDAGGGTGRVSSRLRSLVGFVLISDLSMPMLRRAATKQGLNLLRTRTERLPILDNTFDCILVVDALHHFKNQEYALGELVRVLKPGGRLVIEEPDISRPLIKVIAFIETVMLMKSRFLTADQVEKKLKCHGLNARIENDGKLIYWVQGVKPLCSNR